MSPYIYFDLYSKWVHIQPLMVSYQNYFIQVDKLVVQISERFVNNQESYPHALFTETKTWRIQFVIMYLKDFVPKLLCMVWKILLTISNICTNYLLKQICRKGDSHFILTFFFKSLYFEFFLLKSYRKSGCDWYLGRFDYIWNCFTISIESFDLAKTRRNINNNYHRYILSPNPWRSISSCYSLQH